MDEDRNPPKEGKPKGGFSSLIKSKFMSPSPEATENDGISNAFAELMKDLTSHVNTRPPSKIISFRSV